MYTSPATGVGFPVPVEGEIDLTFEESASTGTIVITSGQVVGLMNGLFPLSADVEGSLDCSRGALVGAELVNGVYEAFGTSYAFEGPLSGVYQSASSSFAGTWSVVEPTAPPGLFGEFGGSGTWTAAQAG